MIDRGYVARLGRRAMADHEVSAALQRVYPVRPRAPAARGRIAQWLPLTDPPPRRLSDATFGLWLPPIFPEP
ncbi:MAG: hypothetical protein ACRDIE_01615 [Chloroflexota bacterium]